MEQDVATTRIKAVFLDIGGVLLTNGWPKESRLAAAERFQFDFEEMERRHELIFAVYEEGRITLEEYLHTILFYQSRSFTQQAFRGFMLEQSLALPGLLNVLPGWRRNHPDVRVFSLNNEPKDIHEYRVEKFALHQIFDGFVASYTVGLRKPDPSIYRLAVGIACVQPEECLYIDDRPVLVDAGKRAGLNGMCHQSPAETLAFLSEI